MNRVTRKCVRTALVPRLPSRGLAKPPVLAISRKQNGVDTGSAPSPGAGVPGSEHQRRGFKRRSDRRYQATGRNCPDGSRRGVPRIPRPPPSPRWIAKNLRRHLFARGIDPCTSRPVNLKGPHRFPRVHQEILRVESRGTRSTFGFFIKVTFQPSGVRSEYFRAVQLRQNQKSRIRTARRKSSAPRNFSSSRKSPRKDGVIQQNPPELEYGLAIDPTGTLLKEVPAGLAQVSNFGGKDEHKGET